MKTTLFILLVTTLLSFPNENVAQTPNLRSVAGFVLFTKTGAVGKQFTAVLVMLLVEDGKLRLDESVRTYLPEAPRTWIVANASLNRLLFADGRFVLVGWNDDAHLQDAPEGQGAWR